MQTPRSTAPLSTLRQYEYDSGRLADNRRATFVSSYDRCKANLRCNWGVVGKENNMLLFLQKYRNEYENTNAAILPCDYAMNLYPHGRLLSVKPPSMSSFLTCLHSLSVDLDQETNDVRYYQRLFDRGQLYSAQLFLDFEDWRMGIRGLSWSNTLPPTAKGFSSLVKARSPAGTILGAHFWPFDFTALGPIIPAYLQSTNEGLVLVREEQVNQVVQQQNLVADLTGRVAWLEENIELVNSGPELRSRYDVRANISAVRADFARWLLHEEHELQTLSASMCTSTTAAQEGCLVRFNTSSLLLQGVINGTGVIAKTSLGTEVAVFAFHSLYLGPEVRVEVVGQRALALVSKTSLLLNTTIEIAPGTLGGFPGGGSVARLKKDRLSDAPDGVYICDLGLYCDTSSSANVNITGLNNRNETLVSNNVNGPGSGNVRVQAFVLSSDASAAYPEIQTITTTANAGQTLSGGFVVRFKTYTTPIIPFDASPQLLQEILQDNLNIVSPASYPIVGDRDEVSTKPAGVGSLSVSRSAADDQLGYTWTITFVSAIGNQELLQTTSFLSGAGARITSATLQQGNELGGGFYLRFLQERTALISATASASSVASALTALDAVLYAYVIRTDPTDNCLDGLCDNGPTKAHGLQWTIYITSTTDNVSPRSPTAPDVQSADDPNFVTCEFASTLTGINATMWIDRGTDTSYYSPQNLLNVSTPFALAFGGSGGSYGGSGGSGFGVNSVGATYNTEELADLLGGSGGAMSPADLFTINAARGPSLAGRGGAGGGAIELVAASDLVIGSYGVIRAQGGMGEQTSDGGGGGGSGGAILLTAGTTAVVEGILDVSGGSGGYGGTSSSLQGGGGGGGRIAIFADTITVADSAASLIATGGSCGAFTEIVAHPVVAINVSASVDVPLGMADLSRIGAIIARQLQLIFPRALSSVASSAVVTNASTFIAVDASNSSFYLPGVQASVSVTMMLPGADYVSVLEDYESLRVTEPLGSAAVEFLRSNASTKLQVYYRLQSRLADALTIARSKPGYGYLRDNVLSSSSTSTSTSTSSATPFVLNLDIGKVVLTAVAIDTFNFTTFAQSATTTPTTCSNGGSAGSIYTQAITTTQAYATEALPGAENTLRALYLSNNESTVTSSGTTMEAPYTGNGPTIAFEASRPSRVTYYIRIAGGASSSNADASKADYGSLFTLISRGESGLNVSNVIGVFFGGNGLMVGANFESNVDEDAYLKRSVTLDPYPNTQKWYKVDLRINWGAKTFRVLLNDTLLAQDLTFNAQDVDGVRITVFRSIQVYYDEIFVGSDATLGFTCPSADRQGTKTSAPAQKGWNYDDVHAGQGLATYTQMNRHYNFLATTGSIPFDGQGQLNAFQDVYTSEPDGDYAAADTLNKVAAGSLSYFTGGARTAKDFVTASQTLASPSGLWTLGSGNPGDGRQYWYTQFDYNASDASAIASFSPYLVGGVAACSTSDLVNWRFEGFAFQYVNLSDTVHRPPKTKPRNANGGSDYIVVRPKVLFDSERKVYVLWAAMDYSAANPRSASETLAMSMVATSPYEDGPFLFRRSFYPDGNRSLDQVPFKSDADDSFVLARSYFLTVEYVLPQAMMQPVWESAKDQSGTINYRANYHRANYDPSYDNFNDIYLQRWRLEDVGYHVICEDRLTFAQRVIAQGEYNSDGFICDFPRERKIILGQGNPNITSRFVSPNDSANSWWRPTSVPAVKAQDWSANYRDGYCGIRPLNDGYSLLDPKLDDFVPVNRSDCSNIADNPTMPTPQDKLIGVLQVVLTRRTKFLAMSRLTSDLLDTTGQLSSFEGALTSGYLLGLITQLGQFSFTAGDQINSTYRAPQRTEYDTAADYKTRFAQYVTNFNDRALYSLACVLDGVCPVNFLDQLSD